MSMISMINCMNLQLDRNYAQFMNFKQSWMVAFGMQAAAGPCRLLVCIQTKALSRILEGGKSI